MSRPLEPATHRAFIALGANLGDRAATIRAALEALKQTPGIEVLRISSLMENPAVGGPEGSPPFLNGAAALATSLQPRELLACLLEIERRLGRERHRKWAPRTIDLDLLLYDDLVLRSDELTIPHPLMHERDFVLLPLAEIAADVLHPLLRLPIGVLAKRVQREPDIHCSSCGYNLRGLPVSGNCPECGKSIKETYEELAEQDPAAHEALRRSAVVALAALAGCAVDGVLFVMDAVTLAERAFAQSGGPGHVTARHVCGAFRAHARSYFNDETEAIELLGEWGVRSSEDVGRIVFAAVRAGRLRASPNDRESDFAGLFTLDTLFS
jgi:2-amino-4-hydroxy-6-hydroxymethyldihydropteridine diphosphokinase